MTVEDFDSRLELVVVEGGGRGGRHVLDRPHMTLGRLDPGDEPTPGTVAFPDPTVSRVHAVLDWDPKKHRYVLEHRSRTNATVINGTQVVGPQVLEAGDKIKLGSLIAQLQRTQERRTSEAGPAPLESGQYLVCLKGPNVGTIYPLNYTRLLLRAPLGSPTSVPGVYVPGAGEDQGVLTWMEGRLLVRSADTGGAPRVVRGRPGAVLEVCADAQGVFMGVDSLLVLGQAVLALAPLERAGELRESLHAGGDPAELHPLLPKVDPASVPAWQGGEEYLLRVLSGTRRGTILAIRAEDLAEPVTIGAAPADLEIPEKRVPRLHLLFTPKRVELLNADESLSFTHNWETVTPGEEIHPLSGDRFTFGRTVVAFEHVPTQASIDALSLFHGDVELPFLRKVNFVGYNPQSDLRIDDRRLGPTHGSFEVFDDRVVYRHKDTASRVTVGERTLTAGEECDLRPGDTLVLAPEIEVRLDRRVTTQRPGDHVLIGPTQEQLEAGETLKVPAEG